jgi:tetratricopeptide (TPR) repeat protein
VELQDQYISGNAGLQVVGANARLGYVYYLQERYDEALLEYVRGLSFVASSDHALKDRTAIEITVKMGAAYHRQGRAAEAARHFERAIRMFDSLIAKGADDPFTRYYIAVAHALAGAPDRAFDSLERVASKLPLLTVARMRRDPDLQPLRDDPRFDALVTRFVAA